jgi:hypothetical protein
MTKLCPRGKAAAKRKFKVYPSAYANAYASKICAGKIKDPSGVKRKDFKGPKPAGKAEGGMIKKDRKGKVAPPTPGRGPRKGTTRPKVFIVTQDREGKIFKAPLKAKGGMIRPKMMGGGLTAATERLKRQGLKKGGGVCKRGMGRAYGKNS